MPTLDYTMLGPITLSQHLRLRGLIDQNSITWEDKRTLGGVLKSRPAHSIGGKKLILDGEGNHFTVGQLSMVLQLIEAGQPVLLLHHLKTATVRVDTITGPILPIDYADYRPEDWVSAQIELTEL